MASELSLVSEKSSPGGGAITSASAPPARSAYAVSASVSATSTSGSSPTLEEKRTFSEFSVRKVGEEVNTACRLRAITQRYAASPLVWSRVWAHGHRAALKGGYAPTLFTMSDTDVREHTYHAAR
jgi:hypothetical protein